jgi:hypothetical protein
MTNKNLIGDPKNLGKNSLKHLKQLTLLVGFCCERTFASSNLHATQRLLWFSIEDRTGISAGLVC